MTPIDNKPTPQEIAQIVHDLRDMPDPTPVDGLTLDALLWPGQTVTHCNTPMTWRGTRSTWNGKDGHGTETLTIERSCPTCGATLTMTGITPS